MLDNQNNIKNKLIDKVSLDDVLKYLNELLHFDDIKNLFTELKSKDPTNAQSIEDNLLPIINELSKKVREFFNNLGEYNQLSNDSKLKILLELQEIRSELTLSSQEVRAKLTPYLSYSETMARRRSDLLSIGREAEIKFLDDLMDGISKYFDDKREMLINRIDKETNLKSRLTDTFITPAAKGLKFLTDKIGMNTEEEHWHKLFLEELLEEELGIEKLKSDLSGIIEKAQNDFEATWQNKVAENPPDIQMLKILSRTGQDSSTSNIGIHLEISTTVLTGGIGAALAATFGLAAGWHTLEYALFNVFPPAAILVVLITAITFKYTEDSTKKSHKEQVEKIIKQYYADIIASLLQKPLSEFNNQSLPQVLTNKSSECIETVIEQWEKQISGNLTVDDYRNLDGLIVNYISKIDTAYERINELIKKINQ